MRIDFGNTQTIATTITDINGVFLSTFIVDNQPSGTTLITISDTFHFSLFTFHFFITQEDLPDLIITKMNISPNRLIFEGDRINVVAWIKNIGSSTAEDIEIRFLDGQIKGTRTINKLRPGQVQAREMTWRIYPAGTHTIEVIADPENKILEIREDNNIVTKTIFVLPKPNKGILMGTVTNLSQQPLPNTLVIAIGKSAGLDMTDDKGRYIIPNLIPGKYLILAIKLGYIPQTKINPLRLQQY